MAEGGEGMLVTAGDWWYINMQKLLETSSSPEIPVNSAGWWNSQIQQLYASFKMSGNLDDNGEHWWNINIQDLLKAANYGSGGQSYLSYSHRIPVNSGSWWYSEIKQLLYNFDLIEIDVDSGYLWYHQIQQLLFAAGKTRQSYDSNWRKKQILKIHQNCNSFEWQGNLVDSGQDWWKRQLNLIEDNSDDSRHKWYSQLQQLLYDFDFKGMEVHFEKLLCEVLAATAKGHLDSVKLLANVLEPIEDSNLKIAEATKVLKYLTMQLEGFSLRANVVDNEDKLYQALIDAADQIFVVRLLLENCISLGGMQILQEAAYRQLVVIMGLELFLETFIEGGKCCVILEDSPKALHGASYRQLVSVRRLPLPLVTNIKQGMRVKFENSNQEWLKAADRHLVSVKRVRQLLETFISQEMLLNEYSWKQVLQQEFRSNYYTELSKFISEERKTNGVYPPENQVFNWTKFCRINDVKVVIFGQDPYTHPGEAHGLSFSVAHGVPLPPSLLNIYRKLKSELKLEPPGHGTLIGWAVQGVLLLNIILTVSTKSHANKGWEEFTNAVISWLNDNLSGVVFMLWGTEARKMAALIDQKKHKIIESSHPSPKSAYYSTDKFKSFMEVSHFSECNTYLREHYKSQIDWSWLPALEA